MFNKQSLFIEWEIFSVNGVAVVVSIIFDYISLSFLGFVRLISSIIIGYSIYYIRDEKNFLRFLFILLLFIGSILCLIIRPNLISLLLGWDGLGLTSYALVIFYQSESSCNSGIITVLSNRVGDSTLLVSVGLIFYTGGWNFIFYDILDFILIFFIILTAITKRAQIPFSAWLPAAIAAPTPVSALVHSSTLVTAGVYLLIRFRNLVESADCLFIVLIVGVITIFISGLVANFEGDLKKVIALSTLRQLGLIFIILGLGRPDLAFFHLVIHALFKSALFICAGFIIHNLHGSQDGRQANLFNYGRPILRGLFSVTNLALCGFPFIAGFYSKDRILENSFRGASGWFLIFIIVLATGFTVSYRFRVIYIRIGLKGKVLNVLRSSDFSPLLILSVFILYRFSITGGLVFSWLILYKGRIFSIFFYEKFYVLRVCVFFFVGMTQFSNKMYRYNLKNKNSSFFSRVMFFLPLFSSYFFRFCFLKKGNYRLKLLDKGWIEYSGPLGLSRRLTRFRLNFQSRQKIIFSRHYAFSFLFFIFLVYNFICLESSQSVALKVQWCI